MGTPYDPFISSFLSKITEYNYTEFTQQLDEAMCIAFFNRALVEFQRGCSTYDFQDKDDSLRAFNFEFDAGDLNEILDIVSDGMVVQWLKPYKYNSDLFSNHLNIREIKLGSAPANMLGALRASYEDAEQEFRRKVKRYRYTPSNIADIGGAS